MKKSIVFILFLLSCMSVFSQEKRLALVIGNGNYQTSTLANPENDARSMEAALKEIGFTVLKYENLEQKEMAKAIDDFGQQLKSYDVGLFFYAGHGVQSKGFNYLIPVDADLASESDVEFDCVRADRLLAKMDEAKSKINIIILDACRNNPFERSWTRSSRSGGLAAMDAPVGSIIAFATAPGSTADDGPGKNGLYTSALLIHINEPGITIDQLFNKVAAEVLKKSKNQQRPWRSVLLTGDFYLVPGSGKADNTLALEAPDIKKDVTDNERSIVVLPFKNLTGKPDLDYLVQGQNEAMITELSVISQVRPLRVLSGQTASKFVDATRSIPEIANEINVDYLIEGSVLGTGDSIILQLRLIQAFPEERPVWAQVYKSNISNVFKLHSNIAGQIVKKIGLDLTADNLAKLPVTRKVNPETYKTYLRGMYWLNQPGQDAQKKGFDYLKEAVAIDPGDPYGYAYLALGYLDVAHGPNDPGDALLKAEAAALQAIKIDTTIAETYSALAQLYLYQLWKFADAEKNFKNSLTMNPNSAITHYHYSWALYLWGRMDEAIAEHKLAQKYDPFNPQHTAWLGSLYCTAGKYEEAINESLKSLEIQKDYPVGDFVLGMTYLEMGRFDEAINAHKKLLEIFPQWSWALGYTYSLTNHRAEAEKILSEIESKPIGPWNAYSRVVMNAALGKRDEAFKWLAYEPHHAWIAWIAVEHWFNGLHGDPRFDEFVRRLNLPKK